MEPFAARPPRGIFLANHDQDTGLSRWPLRRWVSEIDALRRMGADTIWYLPLQYGQRRAADYDGAYWRLQRDICRAILDAGLRVGVYVGINDVFLDDHAARPAWHAEEGRYFLESGQVCLSVPEARAEVVRLRERLFRELPRVDYLITPVTDYGGCSCARCRPWPETYLRQLEVHAELLRKHHPDAKVVAAGHGVPLDDEDQLRGLVAKAGWLDAVADIPRGAGKPVMKYYMAPEITMAGDWGTYGACPLLPQIERGFRFDARHTIGCVQYSEGVHDDVNRFAVLRCCADPKIGSAAIAIEYAEDWLGLSGVHADDMALAILSLGRRIGAGLGVYVEHTQTVRNPLADEQVRVMRAARAAHPEIVDNHRYWLLAFRAACEALQVADGSLPADELVAEYARCRAELARLEPEYGDFLARKPHYLRADLAPWNTPRTFLRAWKRERRFACA